MLTNYQIVDGKLLRADDAQAPIMVYVSPDEAERKHLVNELKLDEHTLGSALDPDELSRLEFEPDHLAIIFKRPRNYSGSESFLLEVDSTGAFLFKDKLIIIVSGDAQLFDGTKFSTRNPSLPGVLLRMIYRSIFHFLEHLKIIDKISDSLQAKINSSMENKYLINLFELQRSLVYYQSSIAANGLLIDKLKNNATKIGFNQEELELLDDIHIENSQCYKQAEINSNILASLMDARVSIVSNNLNILIKVLNIITIAIMVPTFVVSAFSMNVQLPFEDYPYAFLIVMGLAVLSVVGFLAFYRHKKW